MRPKFSLRTLTMTAFLVGCALLLWTHWAPWRLKWSFPLNAAARGITFSADGKLLAVLCADEQGPDTLCVFSLMSGETLVSKEMNDVDLYYRGALTFTKDNQWVVGFAGASTRYFIIHANTGESFIKSDPEITTAVFSPDETRAIICADNSLNLYAVDKPARIATLAHGLRQSVSFSNDSKRVAVREATPLGCSIYDAGSGALLSRINTEDTELSELALSPDGNRLATEGDKPALWDPVSKRKIGVLKGHSPCFAPDGRKLVTSSQSENKIWVWAADTGKLLYEVDGYFLWNEEFSPDGNSIIGVAMDGPTKNTREWKGVAVFNGTTFAKTYALPLTGDFPGWIEFSNDRMILLGDHTWVCNLEDGGNPIFISETFDVACRAHKLAVCHRDGSYALYNAVSGQKLFAWADTDEQDVGTIAFSPDGQQIAHGDRTVCVWEYCRPEQLHGILVRYEFWLTCAAAIALAWSVWHDRKTMAQLH